ncbi:MAG: DUF4198 domain-containing protein [Desulfomonile sp.]|nr:DUF4198 domain-containing protein [Desulfomonile sp.]
MSKRIILAVILLLCSAQLALAHDTWIEKRGGELLVLRGHDGNAEPYDPALVKEPKAFDANGRTIALEIVKNKGNASLSAKESPAIVAALYDSGYWLKTTDGWKKATKREGKDKYTIVESIKSKQWCKGFLAGSNESLKPVGQQFELVPLKDPTTLRAGDTLPMRVIFDGNPVEGAIITTGGDHASDTKNPLKTDKEGKASITVEKSGLQLVKASHQVPIKDDPDADVLYLASTITFVAP